MEMIPFNWSYGKPRKGESILCSLMYILYLMSWVIVLMVEHNHLKYHIVLECMLLSACCILRQGREAARL